MQFKQPDNLLPSHNTSTDVNDILMSIPHDVQLSFPDTSAGLNHEAPPATPPIGQSYTGIMPYPASEIAVTSIPASPNELSAEHFSDHRDDIREKAQFYLHWLINNNKSIQDPEKVFAYQQEALKINLVGKRKIQTFAPFQVHTSALQVITPYQAIILAIIVLSWLLGLILLHTTMFVMTLGAITVLYVFGFVASAILATNSFNSNVGEKIDEGIIQEMDRLGAEWPSYTILCPLYKEVEVVPQFVAAIKDLDYPQDKLQVLFLTEENDQATRAALYSLDLPPGFTVLMLPKGTPQTKPRACNFGLLQAKGQFIVIFDAEDKPEKYQLKKAVLTFANQGPDVACVQAKLNFYNTHQNLLTRLFTAEYSMWFDIMLPGLQRLKFSLPLGGTSNHFRTEVLRAVGGWDAFNVTEDCDLGLRLAQYKLKTAVLDSTTYEEATSRVKIWLFQRSRWIKGYLQTYLVHMRHPLHTIRHYSTSKFVSLQLVVGAWTIVLLINPFMWLFTLIYILFRPVEFYQQIFPGPVLYMGALCMIFGNLFYTYLHIIGCLQRKQYDLIKWVLFIPFYWILMSGAAFIALYQLLTKPHHWEKTQHGNHLTQAEKAIQQKLKISVVHEDRTAASSMPTMLVSAIKMPVPFSTATVEVPAVRSKLTTLLGPRATHKRKLPRIQDRWLIATIILAFVASISSTYYSFTHHLILAYGDSVSHLEIARRVFDNLTPGLAQLGGIWLPLPHLLMIPFVWNDYLWQTGLAGSFVGMGCYMTTAIFIFLSARRLTHSSIASFVGALVYILNPNVLYLQSTPLTEPVCQATYTMTCYYLLAWAQEDKRKYLLLTAIGTLLATLGRYDGWILVVVCPSVILLVGIIKRFSLRQIEGYLLSYIPLSITGIVLWLIWGQVIFGDPLYFQHSTYSSQAQTIAGAALTQFSLRHNLLLDIGLYGIDCIETIGTALSIIAFVAILLFTLRSWRTVNILAALAFLAPFVFYITALFFGQVGLFDAKISFYPLGIIPTSEHTHLFNARFGSEMVAPVAIFIATLLPAQHRVASMYRHLYRYRTIALSLLLIISTFIQSSWITYHGVITVIADSNPPFCVNSYPINTYLAQHYDGGLILQTDYPFQISEAEAGIHFDRIVYEGTRGLWQKALHEPQNYVEWVIFSPKDTVDTALTHNDPSFDQQFTLVASSPFGMRLYHKNGLPSLPSRPLSSYLLSERQVCDIKNYPNAGAQFGLGPAIPHSDTTNYKDPLLIAYASDKN